MYLSEEQAAILICDRSFLTNITVAEIDQYLSKLKSANSGQESILLDTYAKLKFDKDRDAFYVDGYGNSECDCISLYDYLDLLEEYYSQYLQLMSNVPDKYKALERRKLVYQEYKLGRLSQVA